MCAASRRTLRYGEVLFADYLFTLPTKGGDLRVQVCSDVFPCLWKPGDGQNEETIVTANLPNIRELVADQLERKADAKGILRITALDIGG